VRPPGEISAPQAPLPAVRGSRHLTNTSDYALEARQVAVGRLKDLNADARSARNRETVLWVLFVSLFGLTILTGATGAALIFLAGLKLSIASGAASLLPTIASALLWRGHRSQNQRRLATEADRDKQLQRARAAEAIARLPDGPHKETLLLEVARKEIALIKG
jgi:hypothetical protein